MRTAETILGLIHERGKKGLPVERIYRLLFNKDLYLMAYGRIYRNTGAMTHGVTDETPDGMSLEKIDAIIEALRYERYQWLPARRVYIPKKHGKRPLGMPVWSDKLLQEVLRLILEAYYEPQFSDHAHGYRPGRGCHTALREVYYNWKGTKWFIEGDISKCFEKLDHGLLLEVLKKDFQDGRFLNLIRELLDAGYMEEWTFNQTLSGVPQGGVISPILSSILLNKLDKYVENELIPKYTRGKVRQEHSEYKNLLNRAYQRRKKGNFEEAEALKKQAQKLPSRVEEDLNYRRLRYVRYADDFLLGFAGPKSEAEEIKSTLRKYLQEELKLELSEEKTLITHARSEAARFLGYEVFIYQSDTKQTRTLGRFKRRSINGGIGLHIPKDILEAKCNKYLRQGKAIHRTELTNHSDYDIVMVYQQEFRGIANYYQMACNMITLGKLKWIMRQSLIKTLAAKHKLSMTKIAKRYQAAVVVNHRKYQVLQVIVPRPEKKPLIATWGGVPLVWNIQATLEDQPKKLWAGRSELERRLLAAVCELCGDTENIEIHHVRAMKDLREYPGRPKAEWVKRMIALKRKTLALCRTCHEDVTYGRPLRRQSIKLEEVKARQKAKTMILESRMQ